MKKTYVKQTEVNSGGGVRLSVYKQVWNDGEMEHEEPHRITIGPFDDFDAVIEHNNNGLKAAGYPPIDLDELNLPRSLRDVAHAHPMVKDAMVVERKRLDDEIVAAAVAAAGKTA